MTNCSCHLYMKADATKITYPDCAVHGKGGNEPAHKNPEDISLCGSCHCATHTVSGKCGK